MTINIPARMESLARRAFRLHFNAWALLPPILAGGHNACKPANRKCVCPVKTSGRMFSPKTPESGRVVRTHSCVTPSIQEGTDALFQRPTFWSRTSNLARVCDLGYAPTWGGHCNIYLVLMLHCDSGPQQPPHSRIQTMSI